MEVDTNLRFVVVKSGKEGQNSGVVGLPKDLQEVYDGLNRDATIFFNGLKSNKEKTDYLKTIKNSGVVPGKGLPKDLQEVYDGLTRDASIFFNGLKSDK